MLAAPRRGNQGRMTHSVSGALILLLYLWFFVIGFFGRFASLYARRFSVTAFASLTVERAFLP